MPRLHGAQAAVVAASKRFNVLCAGRRWGKSCLGIERCLDPLLGGSPVGWFAPTYKSLDEFWRLISRLDELITVARSEHQHRLEVIGGGVLEMWSLENPDAARGRHDARVILDECAVVRGLLEAWNYVIRPELMDLGGDAWFLSTPKGRNDFALLWQLGQQESEPDWASWRRPTADNPYIAASEIEAIRTTLTARAFEQEIAACFIDEVSGALWKQTAIEAARLACAPQLARIVVAIDPAVTSSADSDETGIVACGVSGGAEAQGYVLADRSGVYSPDGWARAAIALYHSLHADCLVAEANQGGEMVRYTLNTVDGTVPIKLVHASRGKQIRAEPIAALYEQGRIHHVGRLDALELQMTTWSPVDDRRLPDRVDALVWALSELMLSGRQWTIPEILAWGRNDLEELRRLDCLYRGDEKPAEAAPEPEEAGG